MGTKGASSWPTTSIAPPTKAPTATSIPEAPAPSRCRSPARSSTGWPKGAACMCPNRCRRWSWTTSWHWPTCLMRSVRPASTSCSTSTCPTARSSSSWAAPTAPTSTPMPSRPSPRLTRAPTCWSSGMAPRAPSRTWRCNAFRSSSRPALKPCATAASSTTPSASWLPRRATPARQRSRASRMPTGCASACCSPMAA